jgi:predicted metal-dependent enzyme (double-stranded beta helix superfamily)
MTFAIDTLVGELVEARNESNALLATRDVLARAVADPGAVADALDPRAGGLARLYDTPGLTVLNVVWAPGMFLLPHDHRMWAAIGVYAGTEDNVFFRRVPDDRVHIEETGAKELETGEVLLLGDDAIHSVENSRDRVTAAIHVYGGDFFDEPRSQWGPGPAVEQPFDIDFVNQEFAAANARAGL